MTHPVGAVKSEEEMRVLLGKHVYFTAPSILLDRNIPYAAPNIGKIHPLKIVKYAFSPMYMLYVRERVDAAEAFGIAVESNWAVRWVSENLYFFSNFWFAHAHVQQRHDLRWL